MSIISIPASVTTSKIGAHTQAPIKQIVWRKLVSPSKIGFKATSQPTKQIIWSRRSPDKLGLHDPGLTDSFRKVLVPSKIGIKDSARVTRAIYRQVSDRIGLSDHSVTHTAKYYRLTSDTLSLRDVVHPRAFFPRSVSDKIGASDSYHLARALYKVLIDTVTFHDSPEAILDVGRHVSDNIGINTPSVTWTSQANRNIVDGLFLGELILRTVETIRSISLGNVIGMRDKTDQYRGGSAQVSDKIGLHDNGAVLSTAFNLFVAALVNKIGLHDALVPPGTANIALRTLVDIIELGHDHVPRTLLFRRVPSSNLGLHDKVAPIAKRVSRAVSSTLTTADRLKSLTISRRAESDSLGASDATKAATISRRMLEDAVGLHDEIDLSFAWKRFVSSTLTLATLQPNKQLRFRRIAGDKIGMRDFAKRAAFNLRLVSNELQVRDKLIPRSIILRVMHDTVGMSAAVVRKVLWRRVVHDTAGVHDAAQRDVIVKRIIEDGMALLTSAARAAIVYREISNRMALKDKTKQYANRGQLLPGAATLEQEGPESATVGPINAPAPRRASTFSRKVRDRLGSRTVVDLVP
jgi:hypothetical protein